MYIVHFFHPTISLFIGILLMVYKYFMMFNFVLMSDLDLKIPRTN